MWQKKLFILVLFISLFSHANATLILGDNFNDADISDWTVSAGTWSGANLDLNGGLFDPSYIYHSASMAAGADYNISYRVRLGSAGMNNEIMFFSNSTAYSTFSGYSVLNQSATTLFRVVVNGVNTTMFSSAGLSINTWHDINIFLKTDGNRALIIDGVIVGSKIDTNYLSGGIVAISSSNGVSANAIDDIYINSQTGSGSLTVIILRPIDEKINQIIQTPWSVRLTGTINSFTDTNALNLTFPINADSQDVIFTIDDSNGAGVLDTYFPRQYIFKFPPGSSNYSLQPYLVKNTDGVSVVFTVQNGNTNVPVPGIYLISLAPVNGSPTLIESKKTNAAGLASFSFLPYTDYNFLTTNLGDTNYFTGIFNSSDSTYTIRIPVSPNDPSLSSKTGNILITPPNTTSLSGISQRIDINMMSNSDVNNYFFIYDNNILIYSGNTTSNDVNFSQTATLSLFTSSSILVQGVMQFDADTNYTISRTYYIVNSPFQIITGLENQKYNAGIPGLLVISVLIIFGFLSFMGSSAYGNNDAQFFIAAIVLGFLTFLWFSEYAIAFIAAVFLGALAYLWGRSR